jgi:hypothetical protein
MTRVLPHASDLFRALPAGLAGSFIHGEMT